LPLVPDSDGRVAGDATGGNTGYTDEKSLVHHERYLCVARL
jgi:hypothetical protein